MAALTVLAVLASVFTLASPAQAADAIPATQWSASIDNNPLLFAGPSGSVTVGCATYGTNSNLRTYSSTGALTRNIPNTVLIDGVKNCIQRPAIGKDGSIYGTPLNGPNMLAYNTGITLKWKYPTSTCGDSPPEIGADGNIYMITSLSDGVHLIGLTPEVETGKTQPAKVFDVKVPSCGVIQSYKYGIALKIGMDGVRYYSYSGKYIGQASVKDNYTPKEAIDDWGRVFVPLSSQTATARISMYNPNKNAIGWTYSLIPKTIIKELRPVTGGGVAALVVQPVMVASPTPGAPDVPASPARDEKVIIVISPQGTKQRTIPVPDFDARGDEYTSETFAVDGGTKVVVARTLAVKTGRTDPEYLNGTFIGAYDITSGTWSYQTVMKGDAAKTGGASNYVFQPTNENTSDMLLSSGTVGIVAGCTGNCASYSPKLYMVKVAGVNMENPRWNVTNTGPKTASAYIALGDSFSSGEGVPPFEAGSDIVDVNTCHRSTVAYPKLIAGTSTKIPAFSGGGFRACSGAVTDNIGDVPQWNEGIQLDWRPDVTTKLVTLSIGGNDIKFSDFGAACFFGTCDETSTAYKNSLNEIDNALPAKLAAAYRKVLKYAPNAKIYVLGYPQVVANKTVVDGDDIRCYYMKDGDTNWGDARAARKIVTKLNDQIDKTVALVRAENAANVRLNLIRVDGATSPFLTHEVCGTSSTSWFQNVNQGIFNKSYTFHPNDLGQQGYATAAKARINAG